MGRCYKKPYLQEVIARIDFTSKYELPQRGLSQKTSNVILSLFPIPEPREILAKRVDITIDGTKEVAEKQNHLFFHGNAREKTLCISPLFLYFQLKRYDTYEKLKTEFDIILNALADNEDFSVNRFGIRYVNRILLEEENPLDWNKYLNRNLLHMFEIAQNQILLSRAFSNVVQQYDDNMLLNFQYGMHNPDFPSRIRQKLFILDLDASYQGLISREDVEKNIDIAHERIEELFESVITDELRTKMGLQND